MGKLNLNYFDNDLGAYDEFNPRYVFANKYAKKVMNLISSKPAFYYSKTKLSKLLHISRDECNSVMRLLENISSIVIEKENIRINFPFFTKKDIMVIQKITERQLNEDMVFFKQKFLVLNEMAKSLYPNYDSKTTLYHLLCGKIFDGKFFDCLEEKQVLKGSYPKKDNRDYVIVGYKNDRYCNKFNDYLVCSFNNARFKESSLSSFGTPSGSRIDYFRYFKKRENNKIGIKYLRLNKLFKNIETPIIIENSLTLIKNIKEGKQIKKDCYSKGLIITNYITSDYKLKVPVYDNYIEKTEDLYKCVIELMGERILQSLNNVKNAVFNSQLNVVKHDIDPNEVCNELWHIYFGMLNRLLIKFHLVSKPRRYFTQGEYLKCVYMD